jgi:hypothetical protein
MNGKLAEIDSILSRIERLADELKVDPDGHVLRSANELRTAFGARHAIEPAVVRMRESVQTLLRDNPDSVRRELPRRSHGVNHLGGVVEQELVPHLRRLGFDV